jgi:hypothetical protein
LCAEFCLTSIFFFLSFCLSVSLRADFLLTSQVVLLSLLYCCLFICDSGAMGSYIKKLQKQKEAGLRSRGTTEKRLSCKEALFELHVHSRVELLYRNKALEITYVS